MTGREGHLSILHTWTLSLSIDLMCSVTRIELAAGIWTTVSQ